MSALVVDTTVWVEFFRGKALARLEQALQDGDVVLPPIVAAELLSAPLGARERGQLEGFLRDLPMHPAPIDHWFRVGALRAAAARRGVTVSGPDAHVAQVALDLNGSVWSNDQVFKLLASKSLVRTFAPD